MKFRFDHLTRTILFHGDGWVHTYTRNDNVFYMG